MGLPRVPDPDDEVLHVHSHTAGSVGPISRRGLASRLAEGSVPAGAFLWMNGMTGWEPLDDHRGSLALPVPDGPADSVPTVSWTTSLAEPVSPAASATAPTALPAPGPATSPEAAPAPSRAPTPAPVEAPAPVPAVDAPSPAAAPEPVAVAPADLDPAPAARPGDDEDRVFTELVRSSWRWLAEKQAAAHLDEVFVGAVITSTLDTGYSLIDLASDGRHHDLRFEKLDDQSRIVVRLTHLTPELSVAKVLGQRMSAVIGYGERVANLGKIWSALSAELKSSYLQDAEPGTITIDGDVASGYVYCQVDLYLDLELYIGPKYAIDNARLTQHLGAVTAALRKYLRGRFT